jgi:hypothetical protein
VTASVAAGSAANNPSPAQPINCLLQPIGSSRAAEQPSSAAPEPSPAHRHPPFKSARSLPSWPRASAVRRGTNVTLRSTSVTSGPDQRHLRSRPASPPVPANVTPGLEQRHLRLRTTSPCFRSTSPRALITLPSARSTSPSLVGGWFVAHRPLVVKVNAPRRRNGWLPCGHGSFLAASSGLRFSLSLRSLP